MLFNSTYQFGPTLPYLSQEEINNTPEIYCFSLEETVRYPIPNHLRETLLALPWTGRPNFIQVRVQTPIIFPPRGNFWHLDLDTRLANGTVHLAKSLTEFRSMTVSFGDVVEAEFIKDPFELDLTLSEALKHYQVDDMISRRSPVTIAAQPNQLVTYTSRDFHRAGQHIRSANTRLIIVTVEMDEPLPPGSGWIK